MPVRDRRDAANALDAQQLAADFGARRDVDCCAFNTRREHVRSNTAERTRAARARTPQAPPRSSR
ncbi:MAG: hypothetical protein ABJD97_13685, partial [Betaproteobacteria bacterium]